MTAQSPESIAMVIMLMSRKETGKLDPFYDHNIIFKEIIEAIKAERENNRLVLPERKSGEYWGKPPASFAESVRAHNECLDEITRLNDGRVKPDARYSGQVFISKDACDFTEQFLNYLASIKEGTKYRVEFYKLDEG